MLVLFRTWQREESLKRYTTVIDGNVYYRGFTLQKDDQRVILLDTRSSDNYSVLKESDLDLIIHMGFKQGIDYLYLHSCKRRVADYKRRIKKVSKKLREGCYDNPTGKRGGLSRLKNEKEYYQNVVSKLNTNN